MSSTQAAGATVAHDSSGLGHNGAIGSHLVMNGQYAHFDRHPPGEGISYGYDHLISVPDAADGSLDPGAGDFSVEIRYRAKESFGNVLQKGQATGKGGQVKFQQPGGKLTCMFKTPPRRGHRRIGGHRAQRLPVAHGPLRPDVDVRDDVCRRGGEGVDRAALTKPGRRRG